MAQLVIAKLFEIALPFDKAASDLFQFCCELADLFLQLLEILGAADLLSFEQPDRTAGNAEPSSRKFSAFCDERILITCGNILNVAFVYIDPVQDEGHEFFVLRIKLNDLGGGKSVGIDPRRGGLKLFEGIQNKEVRFSF